MSIPAISLSFVLLYAFSFFIAVGVISYFFYRNDREVALTHRDPEANIILLASIWPLALMVFIFVWTAESIVEYLNRNW